jgi:hypothetical protein
MAKVPLSTPAKPREPHQVPFDDHDLISPPNAFLMLCRQLTVMTLGPILVPNNPPYGSVSPRLIRGHWRHHFASRVRLRSGIFVGTGGLKSDHHETPKEARTGWTGTNVRDHEVGTHAFTRDLCPIWFPSPAYPWVHFVLPDSSWTNRRSAASRMLACLLLALDVKLLLTVNHTSVAMQSSVGRVNNVGRVVLPDYLTSRATMG